MEQLGKTVSAFFSRRKSPSYRPVQTDRADDDAEDSEAVVDVPEQRRHFMRSTVRDLAFSLVGTPMSDLFGDVPSSLRERFAQHLRVHSASYCYLAEQLMHLLQEEKSVLFQDEDGGAVPSFVRVLEPRVYLVDLFALFEMLCLAKALAPAHFDDVTLHKFLHGFGNACDLELTTADAASIGLFAPAINGGRHCAVIAHHESAFSQYSENLLQCDVLQPLDMDDSFMCELQVVPLPAVIAAALVGQTSVPGDDFCVFPMWPYLAWRKCPACVD
jgi:hypothetical protein